MGFENDYTKLEFVHSLARSILSMFMLTRLSELSGCLAFCYLVSSLVLGTALRCGLPLLRLNLPLFGQGFGLLVRSLILPLSSYFFLYVLCPSASPFYFDLPFSLRACRLSTSVYFGSARLLLSPYSVLHYKKLFFTPAKGKLLPADQACPFQRLFL